MSRESHHHDRNAGFTLVELMVVISLIGIMTAMIIPAMKGTFEDALLRSTSRKLVAACNLASIRAVAINQMHLLRLDLKKGRYTLERPVREREEGGDLMPVRDIPGGEGELDTRIEIEVRKPMDDEEPDAAERPDEPPGQRDALSFYPDGTADAAEIILRDREGFRLSLRINPTTGRVNIKELDPESKP